MAGASFHIRTSRPCPYCDSECEAFGDLCPRDLPKQTSTHTHTHTAMHGCLCVCVSSFSVAEVKGLGRCQRGHGERRRGPGTLNPIFPLLEEQMFELCFSANSFIVIQMHICIRSDTFVTRRVRVGLFFP